ncbi:MAG: acyl carrier protein [Gemmatimonadetes bacterium]|nr:acyl carrier protein [Gemmatimonadota bacterium]
MTHPSTEQRLRHIVAHVAHVPPDSFALDDELAIELGLDSLSVLRVVAGVEREFGMTIEDERLHDLQTLRAILVYLEQAAGAGPHTA